MAVFHFLVPPTVQVSTLNMILNQVRNFFDSSHPLVVPGLDNHSSLSLSSLLKNEIDPPPLQSILMLDRVLEPCFPPPSENVSISNQQPK
jgi:hypothetical protein